MDLQHSEVAIPQSLLNNLSRPASYMCKASLICNNYVFVSRTINNSRVLPLQVMLVGPCMISNRWFSVSPLLTAAWCSPILVSKALFVYSKPQLQGMLYTTPDLLFGGSLSFTLVKCHLRVECVQKSPDLVFFANSPQVLSKTCNVRHADTDYVLLFSLLVVPPFSFVELPDQLCKLESHCLSKLSLGVPPLVGHCLPSGLFWLHGINMRPLLFRHGQDGEKSIADTYQYVKVFYTPLSTVNLMVCRALVIEMFQ